MIWRPRAPDGVAPLRRVWDLPVRLTHWSLVALIGLCWFSAEQGKMDLHRWCGCGVLALVVFRIYWGLVGTSTARFSDFVKGPAGVAAYMRTLPRRKASNAQGHNPLGALSVLALLGLMSVQTVLGLFSVDVDGIESGPLSSWVDFDTGRRLAELHELTFNLLLATIALHLAAVAFYLVYKRENLVGAMVTGSRAVEAGAPPAVVVPIWRLVAGCVIAGAIFALLVKLS